MHHPDDITGLTTQPHQGVAARVVRRFAGMARAAVSGIVRLQHPVAPPATPVPPAAETPKPPRRPRAARRTSSAPSAPSPRPGWIARWFGRHRRSAASPAWMSDGGDTVFTPERYPQLTAGDCALLNTPVEDCDPEVLRLLLSGLATHIARTIGMGGDDAEAVFGMLWQHMGPISEPAPDDARSEQPDDAPPVASGAAANPPPASLDPPPALPDSPPALRDDAPPVRPDEVPPAASDAAANPPPASPDHPPAAHAPDEPRATKTPGTAAPAPPPDTGLPLEPGTRRSRTLRRDDHRFRHRRRSSLSRSPRGRPPPRRLRHVASTGPPLAVARLCIAF